MNTLHRNDKAKIQQQSNVMIPIHDYQFKRKISLKKYILLVNIDNEKKFFIRLIDKTGKIVPPQVYYKKASTEDIKQIVCPEDYFQNENDEEDQKIKKLGSALYKYFKHRNIYIEAEGNSIIFSYVRRLLNSPNEYQERRSKLILSKYSSELLKEEKIQIDLKNQIYFFHGVTYWKKKIKNRELQCVYDSQSQCIFLRILDTQRKFTTEVLSQKSQPMLNKTFSQIQQMFKTIISSTDFSVNKRKKTLILENPDIKQISLLKVKDNMWEASLQEVQQNMKESYLSSQIEQPSGQKVKQNVQEFSIQKLSLSKKEEQNIIGLPQPSESQKIQEQSNLKASFRIELFKHIFLTQIIARMIIYQFGRSKKRKRLEKYDKFQRFNQKGYLDQQLDELRGFGRRLSEFGDPIILEQKDKVKIWKKFRKQGKNPQIKLQVQKVVGTLRQVPSEVSSEDVQNLIWLSGVEKSQINKKRYCLHQMTCEMDYTEAYIDFVSLILQYVAKETLFPPQEGVKKTQDNMMKGSFKKFKNDFKTKRDSKSCLIEYTKETFFHKILNLGLRSFKKPFELNFLRLPFSHMFWSIKNIYFHHLKKLWGKKETKKKGNVLFRGCSLTMKELQEINTNKEGLLQLEGFISTSIDQSRAIVFAQTALMKIQVPFCNMGGIFDNGLAHISPYSVHANEKEVLINAFNLFKVVAVQKFNQNIYRINLEAASIRNMEQKKIDLNVQEELNRRNLQKNKNQIKLVDKQLKKRVKKNRQDKDLLDFFRKIQEDKKKHDERSQQLDSLQKNELLKRIKKQFSTWEKQLVLQHIHQLKIRQNCQNYGRSLLFAGEFEQSSRYFEKVLKQTNSEIAMEGCHWKKSQFLIEKKMNILRDLSACYSYLGRPKDSLFLTCELVKINKQVRLMFQKQEQTHHLLLYNRYFLSTKIINQQHKTKQYLKEFQELNEKNKLIFPIKGLSQVEKKQKALQFEEELKLIQLEYGKKSVKYLQTFGWRIQLLESPVELINKSKDYFQIKNQIPQSDSRFQTQRIINLLLQKYQIRESTQIFQWICEQILNFLKPQIYDFFDFKILFGALNQCLELKIFQKGRLLILKLIKITIRCQIPKEDIEEALLVGYFLLVKSKNLIEQILQYFEWLQNFQESQQYFSQEYLKLLRYIKNYNKQSQINLKRRRYTQQNIMHIRSKDQQDDSLFTFLKKNEHKNQWLTFDWEDRRGNLILWQQPFKKLRTNLKYLFTAIDHKFLKRMDSQMMTELFKVYLNSCDKKLDQENLKFYSTKLTVVGKLHFPRNYYLKKREQLIFEKVYKKYLKTQNSNLFFPLSVQTSMIFK